MLLPFLLFNQAVFGIEYSVSRAAHGKQIRHSYVELRGDVVIRHTSIHDSLVDK